MRWMGLGWRELVEEGEVAVVLSEMEQLKWADEEQMKLAGEDSGWPRRLNGIAEAVGVECSRSGLRLVVRSSGVEARGDGGELVEVDSWTYEECGLSSCGTAQEAIDGGSD